MKLIAIVYGMDQMPTECHECQYFYQSEKGDWWCSVLQTWISQEHKKHIECPLRPLPQKSDGVYMPVEGMHNVEDRAFCEGWDRCLEEITGETE